MYRFALTAALVAALAVPAGTWLDGRLREARRLELAEFERRVEQTLDKPISLAEIAGGNRTMQEVLRHIAGQVGVPMLYNRTMLSDGVLDAARVNIPETQLSLRSSLGILSHQVSLGYYADRRGLVITSSPGAGGRWSTRVYPLPQLAGPEKPYGSDLDTWIDVLSVVIEPDTWSSGGPAEVVPVPGALIVRQTQQAHERLRQFFERLQHDSPSPDAQADYLASFSSAERRIHAVLETPCDFQCASAPLYEALDELSWRHGIPIVLRQPKLEEAKINLNAPLTLKMEGASLRSVLRSMLEQAGLTYVICDDVLQVTTQEDSYSEMHMMVYDVRDLVMSKKGTDFDSLADLISTTVEPDSWDGRSGPGPFQEMLPGWLAFSETDPIHEGTATLLTRLREQMRPRSGGKQAVAKWTPAEQRIAAAMKREVKLDYQGLPLQDVVADLAEQTGINMRLDKWMIADPVGKIDIPVFCDLPPLPLKMALRRLLELERLADAELAWCIHNESLVLTSRVSANSRHELLIMGVRSLAGPGDDENAFEEENLVELIETMVQPRNRSGAARISTFQSQLVVSAPRDVNERVRKLVDGLTSFRDESLVSRQKLALRGMAPVAIGDEDSEDGLLRIYPVEDLVGAEGPDALEELQDAISEIVLKESWADFGGPARMMAVPPGALLVSQKQKGHKQLEEFLDELRQHVVPDHPVPPWLMARDEDERLAFFDVRELLSRPDPFDEDELCCLLDGSLAEELSTRGQGDSPVCFRGWLVVPTFDQRRAQLAGLVRWLQQQSALPRALAVRERREPAETGQLIRRLLASQDALEQLYLAFVLQFAAAPEGGLEELAARVEHLEDDSDLLLAIRLKEAINRWVAVFSNQRLETVFADTDSPLLRKAAMQTLSSRLSLREPTGKTLETQTDNMISARSELSTAEVADLRLALSKRQSPPVYRTLFEEKDRSYLPLLLRGSSPSLPPWRQRRGGAQLGKYSFQR